MRVRLLQDRATLAAVQSAGDEVEVSPAEAKRMIEAGQAQPVRRSKPDCAVPAATAEKAAR